MTGSETKAGEDRLLEDRLLDRAYHLAGGDTRRPVDLQQAGGELGLSAGQMLLLLGSLVENGYLLPSEQPDGVALYLTPKAVDRMASIETRR